MRRSLLTLLLLALVACDDGGDERAPKDAGAVDPPTPPRPTSPWEDTARVANEAGRSARLALAADGVYAAWYAVEGVEDGVCTGENGAESPATRWGIQAARLDGEAWAVEEVAAPFMLGQPTQLDMAVNGAGAPVIVAQTGEPLIAEYYCGAHDVGLFTRGAGGWDLETLVTSSGQAATGDPASDFGEVVGHWPALAYGPDGAAGVVYKDIHGGGLQGDDRVRADLEFNLGGAASAIDAGNGAGDLSAVIFDAEGRPVVAWYNTVSNSGEDRRGVWVARLEEGAWVMARIAQESALGIDLALNPETGAIALGWYSGERGRPALAELPADGALDDPDAWTQAAFGDPRYDEGYHIELAYSPSGRLSAAWYRCARVGAELGVCEPDDDAAVFAWRIDGEWQYEVVEKGDAGLCGMEPALVYGADDRPRMIWRCSRPIDDTFRFRLEGAAREALP